MLLRIPRTQIASYLLHPGGWRQPISRFLVHNLWHGSRMSAPFKSKFEDLMTPGSQKHFSSNSPSPTQPPSVDLEVDPLALYNDEINEEILARDPKPTANNILYQIIEVSLNYKDAFLDESYVRYGVCQLLLNKYEELPNMILDAWKKKDFKPIRTLRILQKNPLNNWHVPF
ncbi:hypothetical protein JOM56_007540 [Amanita muscaria]